MVDINRMFERLETINDIEEQVEILSQIYQFCKPNGVIEVDNQNSIREAGGFKILSDILLNVVSTALKEACLSTLTICIEKNEVNQLLLCTRNFFDYLYVTLKYQHCERRIEMVSMLLLMNIVSRNNVGQRFMFESSCLHLVVDKLKNVITYKIDAVMGTWKCLAQQLSNWKEWWQLICNLIGVCVNNPRSERNQLLCTSLIPHAIDLLKRPLGNEIENTVFSLLELLMEGHTFNQNKFRYHGGLEVLLKKLRRTKTLLVDKVEENGSATNTILMEVQNTISLFVMSVGNNDESIRSLLNSNMMTILLNFLECKWLPAALTDKIICFLLICLERNAILREQCWNHNGMSIVISHLLRSNSSETKKLTQTLLKILLQEDSVKNASSSIASSNESAIRLGGGESNGLLATEPNSEMMLEEERNSFNELKFIVLNEKEQSLLSLKETLERELESVNLKLLFVRKKRRDLFETRSNCGSGDDYEGPRKKRRCVDKPIQVDLTTEHRSRPRVESMRDQSSPDSGFKSISLELGLSEILRQAELRTNSGSSVLSPRRTSTPKQSTAPEFMDPKISPLTSTLKRRGKMGEPFIRIETFAKLYWEREKEETKASDQSFSSGIGRGEMSDEKGIIFSPKRLFKKNSRMVSTGTMTDCSPVITSPTGTRGSTELVPESGNENPATPPLLEKSGFTQELLETARKIQAKCEISNGRSSSPEMEVAVDTDPAALDDVDSDLVDEELQGRLGLSPCITTSARVQTRMESLTESSSGCSLVVPMKSDELEESNSENESAFEEKLKSLPTTTPFRAKCEINKMAPSGKRRIPIYAGAYRRKEKRNWAKDYFDKSSTSTDNPEQNAKTPEKCVQKLLRKPFVRVEHLQRVDFLSGEMDQLYKGVERYGQNFKAIMDAYGDKFHASRTTDHLAKKWKSVTSKIRQKAK